VKFGLIFMTLGLVLGGTGVRALSSVPGWLLLSAGFAFLGVGLAYLFAWPGLIGKTRGGKMLPSSYVFLWPYHVLNWLSLLLLRQLRAAAPCNEILPGLFLGGRLLPRDAALAGSLGIRSVLDLTSEFSEAPCLRKAEAYCCIPLLDGTAPRAEELALGIDFLRARLPHGPVYVHCAMGHGRSATFVAGYLIAARHAATAAEAEEFVRRRRPRVRLYPAQRESLRHLEARTS
jgi:hypothetical protein